MHTMRLAITATGSLGAALAAYALLLNSSFLDTLELWTAGLTGFVLRLVGAATFTEGTVIANQGFAIQIVAECTIFGPLLLYLAAVAAYPARLSNKLSGLTLGLAILVPLNTFRIVSLFFIGETFPGYLDTAHFLVWQPLLLLLTVALWVWWASKLPRAIS